MKTEKTIVNYTCDACGKEIENPKDFVNGSLSSFWIKEIVIAWHNHPNIVINDMCWECESKLYTVLFQQSNGFNTGKVSDKINKELKQN